MSQMTLWMPATTEGHFTPDAFDHHIGKPLRLNFGGFGEEGILVRAEVAEDGSGARLTLELAAGEAKGSSEEERDGY